MHSTKLLTAPSVEPLSVDEVQRHLKVSGEDVDLAIYITTARKFCERYLNRSLNTQTWISYYDYFQNEICLPYPKVQSVTSIKYWDVNQTQQVLPTSSYWVKLNCEPCEIVRAFGVTYPLVQYGRPNAIEIQYVAGYGDLPTDVPEEIRHAMKLLIADWYEQRGTIVIGLVNKIPNYLIDLLHPYKIYNF